MHDPARYNEVLTNAGLALAGLAMGSALVRSVPRTCETGNAARLPQAGPPVQTSATVRAARRLNRAAGILAASVLADSSVEHYRGSFKNKAMFTPLIVSALTLATSIHGTTDMRPAAHRVRDTTYLLRRDRPDRNRISYLQRRQEGRRLQLAEFLLCRAARCADGHSAVGPCLVFAPSGSRESEPGTRPRSSICRRAPGMALHFSSPTDGFTFNLKDDCRLYEIRNDAVQICITPKDSSLVVGEWPVRECFLLWLTLQAGAYVPQTYSETKSVPLIRAGQTFSPPSKHHCRYLDNTLQQPMTDKTSQSLMSNLFLLRNQL